MLRQNQVPDPILRPQLVGKFRARTTVLGSPVVPFTLFLVLGFSYNSNQPKKELQKVAKLQQRYPGGIRYLQQLFSTFRKGGICALILRWLLGYQGHCFGEHGLNSHH